MPSHLPGLGVIDQPILYQLLEGFSGTSVRTGWAQRSGAPWARIEQVRVTSIASPIWNGPDRKRRLPCPSSSQLREPISASGLVTSADFEEAIALCDDPGFGFVSQITMAARARGPEGD